MVLAVLVSACIVTGTAAQPFNILFIAVDDLRPQLGCYGNTLVQSPNIDRLAREGALFDRAYCQVPVCGASRASLMTGVRPTRTRFLNYNTWAIQDAPGVIALPQHFRHHGYTTISLGKIFHHVADAPESWSMPAWRPKTTRGNWRDYADPENQRATDSDGRGPPYESSDVADGAYADGKIATRAVVELQRLKQANQPFFLAVGFLKPHLPFNAPRRYWDLYDPASIQLPDNYHPPQDVPAQAMHNWGELRSYQGVPKRGPVPEEMALKLVRGYHACVSYMDAQVGRVLDELDRLGLKNNTIVVLWGDHGWNLGEHTLWCKHCNFDNALRVPLLLRVPGHEPARRSSALVEFVDLYPTLCELGNLPLPEHLEGTSLVPLLKDPARPWKPAVFSRWIAGDSIRTDRYLYTEWPARANSGPARMLFDHHADPDENTNVAELPDNAALVKELSERLRAGWQRAKPRI
jgi:arylsulfatase A-like enzyme